jgi:26S proteasome regulatory subunit N8
LLRDVKDNAVGTLSTRVTTQLNSLKGLQHQLEEIHVYLGKVVSGKLPMNHKIIYNLQNIFNLLPNLNVPEIIRAFHVKTNDQLMVVYISSLARSIIALHNLINNKIENRDAEQKENEPPVAKKVDDKSKEEGKDGKATATTTADSGKK